MFCTFAGRSETDLPRGRTLTPESYIMAVVNSTAIGNASKTAGELTYRRTKGRTIASRRITTNKSNTEFQKLQRSAFSIMTKSAKSLSSWIGLNFVSTKYGTPRNAFMKTNAPVFGFIKDNTENIHSDGLGGLVESVTLGATVQVANGNRSISIIPNISDDKSISLAITYGGEMAPGDIISVLILRKIESAGVNGRTLRYALANTYQYVLIGSDLTDPGRVVIDEKKVPALGTCLSLVGGMTSVTVAVAAVVNTDGEKCSSILYDAGATVEDDRPGEL